MKEKKMPLNVRRFFTSVFATLVVITGIISAQETPSNQPAANPVPNPLTGKQPTSAEVMRERISKAKAYIAVRNYNAAIYELENIRRESSDQSVNAVTNVLLMNSYLEQGDYKRAQGFLNEFFKSYKSNSASGNMYYSSVAAQIIKGARNQVERYRSLGLNVSDRNLPLEAVNDIERMRETLELVITQAKELGADKTKAAAAMALLEEATNSRGMIARDDYDARRWRDELGDSREQIASSRSVIINAVDGTTVANPVAQQTVAANTSAASNPPLPLANTPAISAPESSSGNTPAQPVFKPVPTEAQSKPVDAPVATNKPAVDLPKLQPSTSNSNEAQRTRVIENKPTVEAPVQAPVVNNSTSVTPAGPMSVGSLIAYATKQHAPIYPPAARSMRTTGVVKVEVTINETGEVDEVQNASGPGLLQTAAKDAIRKWKFKPFVRDGQPVRAVGFVNFNFSL
ncbi:MAG TPA: TonB family protein [Pyrinomonadaceae bacterium]